MENNKNNYVILGLGSNLGQRLENIKNCCEKLGNIIKITDFSNIYSSQALLPDNAPDSWNIDFYNCVIVGYTSLNRETFHEEIKKLEQEINKNSRNSEFWSPRMMDIDIISFNDEVFESDQLNLPHKRMKERTFVIWPLADIKPDWNHPQTKENIVELAQNFGVKYPDEVNSADTPLKTKKLDIKPL